MNITQYKDKVVQAGLSDEATRVLLGLEFQVRGDDAYIDSLSIARELGIGHNEFLKTIRKFIETQVEIGNFGGMGKFTQTSNQPIKGVIETTYINNQNGLGKFSQSSKGVIESTYVNSQNKQQPLFLLNEKAALRSFAPSSYFIESQYINEQGKSQPMYFLTKKGTARLVMGFTGINAERFKIGYIERFDQMEQQIQNARELLAQAVPTLSPLEMMRILIAFKSQSFWVLVIMTYLRSFVSLLMIKKIRETFPTSQAV